MLVYSKPTACFVCGSVLQPHILAARDEVYGVAGEWDLVKCSDVECGTVHLSHDLTAEQLKEFYVDYGTHSPPVLHAAGLKLLYRDALRRIWHRRLGYLTPQQGAAGLIGSILDRVPYFRQAALARVYWLPYLPGGQLIEIGFGNAQTLALLRDLGWSVTGSEFDEVCVTQARSLGLEVVQGSFFDGAFASGSADAVVASHVIEHVPDPAAFVKEAARVLKPGGALVLVTPNAASRGARRAGRHWRGLEVPRHLSIHTPGSLRRMAEQAGFSQIEVFGTALGGFIMQQSRELSHGAPASSRQSAKTIPYHVLASARAAWRHEDSDEIVLRCRAGS